VIFDTDAREATWSSLAGSERARLDAQRPERVPFAP
jgi:hypothetical protein